MRIRYAKNLFENGLENFLKLFRHSKLSHLYEFRTLGKTGPYQKNLGKFAKVRHLIFSECGILSKGCYHLIGYRKL